MLNTSSTVADDGYLSWLMMPVTLRPSSTKQRRASLRWLAAG
jgi:hypothetical protein